MWKVFERLHLQWNIYVKRSCLRQWEVYIIGGSNLEIMWAKFENDLPIFAVVTNITKVTKVFE